MLKNTNTNIKGKEVKCCIDDRSYEKGFEDGYEEGRLDTLETLPKFKFFLITVMDREIITSRFRTRDEARRIMRKQFIEAGGDIEENNDYATLNENSAWVNDGDNHSNFDWRIVEVNEIPIFN